MVCRQSPELRSKKDVKLTIIRDIHTVINNKIISKISVLSDQFFLFRVSLAKQWTFEWTSARKYMFHVYAANIYGYLPSPPNVNLLQTTSCCPWMRPGMLGNSPMGNECELYLAFWHKEVCLRKTLSLSLSFFFFFSFSLSFSLVSAYSSRPSLILDTLALVHVHVCRVMYTCALARWTI